MDLCEHEDDPNICPVATCNPRGAREVEHDIGPRFEAKYDGHCAYGHCMATDIEEGDDLRMVDGVAWHAACAESLKSN